VSVTDSLEESRNESDTVAALRAGDVDVFEMLVREHTPGLTRLARTWVPHALADEVVQETWASVVESIDRFEQRASLKTWIYQILFNKVRTLAKRESKIIPFAAMGHTGSDDEPTVDPDRLNNAARGPGHWTRAPSRWDLGPDEQLTSSETLQHVRAAISQLPEAQREVVELRDVQGWESGEVCNALGISAVNQRVLLHRGRAAVRTALEEYLTND
jgi:RNA polymerase sigma-70 factor (ECF subfamily)